MYQRQREPRAHTWACAMRACYLHWTYNPYSENKTKQTPKQSNYSLKIKFKPSSSDVFQS